MIYKGRSPHRVQLIGGLGEKNALATFTSSGKKDGGRLRGKASRYEGKPDNRSAHAREGKNHHPWREEELIPLKKREKVSWPLGWGLHAEWTDRIIPT